MDICIDKIGCHMYTDVYQADRVAANNPSPKTTAGPPPPITIPLPLIAVGG